MKAATLPFQMLRLRMALPRPCRTRMFRVRKGVSPCMCAKAYDAGLRGSSPQLARSWPLSDAIPLLARRTAGLGRGDASMPFSGDEMRARRESVRS